MEANAHALARYAALAQEAGLVPIVEPEVLMDGAHGLERCAEVTVATLRAVYEQLARHRVVLEASLLKPNMVLPGKDCPIRPSNPGRRGDDRCLRQAVPAGCPGSSSVRRPVRRQATVHLDALNRGRRPWELSFTIGRAAEPRC